MACSPKNIFPIDAAYLKILAQDFFYYPSSFLLKHNYHQKSSHLNFPNNWVWVTLEGSLLLGTNT